MTDYRYTTTTERWLGKCGTKTKGDSSARLNCSSLTEASGFAENGWTLMDTIYGKDGVPIRRYAKMLYTIREFAQVKPPMKSLFGHKPEESAKYGEVV
jgi:hypothetical protein